MRITSLEVDGFGVWSGLKLDEFSDGLNVFYGPNEAGKTTLMQFIRSVLYGFSPERRRYFPPLGGGRPGGALRLAGPDGQFEVTRHDDIENPGAAELVTLTSADGARQGEHEGRNHPRHGRGQDDLRGHFRPGGSECEAPLSQA